MIILAVVLLPCSCISVRQAFIPSLSFYPFKSRKDRTQFLMHLKSSNLGLLKGPHIFGEAMTWWLDEILLQKLLFMEKKLESHHSLMTLIIIIITIIIIFKILCKQPLMEKSHQSLLFSLLCSSLAALNNKQWPQERWTRTTMLMLMLMLMLMIW